MSDQNPPQNEETTNLQTDQPDEPVDNSVPAGDPTVSPNKDESASPPQDVTPGGEVVPENDNVTEDDTAEPADADVNHDVSEEEAERNA